MHTVHNGRVKTPPQHHALFMFYYRTIKICSLLTSCQQGDSEGPFRPGAPTSTRRLHHQRTVIETFVKHT